MRKENDFAAVNVRSNVNCLFDVESEVKQGCVLFLLIWIVLMAVLKNTENMVLIRKVKLSWTRVMQITWAF